MYFNFPCPSCGKTLKVREELAGRKAKCPYCRAAVSVPESVATEDAREEVSQSAAGGTVGPTDSAEPRRGSEAAARKSAAAGAPTPGLPQIAVGPRSGPPAVPRGPRVAPRTETGAAKRVANENDDGTNVSLLLTSATGLGLTAVFYFLLLPLPAHYFRDLFYDRGWVTVAEAFLLFWSASILFFKSMKLRRQRESMLFDLLPESLGREISVHNADRFAASIRELPVNPGASFLVQRVLRGLEHYTVRRSASEVSTVLASQSELDSHAVNSSYALLNVFIWAIPILGFIGTVMGLGTAVGSLGVQDTTDIEGIKESLGAITGGLGVAFDTTLVALIMSLMLKFPASSLQKAEEDLLNWVDEYCNENLLKRLKDAGGDLQLEPDEISRTIKRAIDQNLGEVVEHARESVRLMTEQSEAAQRQLAQIVRDSADTAAGAAVSLAEHLKLLQQAVVNMNQVLGELDGKQVVIQAVERPRRRWFRLGAGRENTT
jgi:biopolymer transport protein ExbB/TolQ